MAKLETYQVRLVIVAEVKTQKDGHIDGVAIEKWIVDRVQGALTNVSNPHRTDPGVVGVFVNEPSSCYRSDA